MVHLSQDREINTSIELRAFGRRLIDRLIYPLLQVLIYVRKFGPFDPVANNVYITSSCLLKEYVCMTPVSLSHHRFFFSFLYVCMYVCMCVCVIDTTACVFATDELLKQVFVDLDLFA